MPLKMSVMTISAIGVLLLSACNSGNQATAPTSSPAASVPAETQSPAAASPAAVSPAAKGDSDEKHGGQGGQVIESGQYHLEFVPEKEATETHIDFFLQKGDNHEPIPNAKVTAQVQLPDGSQKSLSMKYDAIDKHYTVILPGNAAGEYKVAILSDISGEKVNGRFGFKR